MESSNANINNNKSIVFNNTTKVFSKLKARGISGLQMSKYQDFMKDAKNLSPVVTNYIKTPFFDKKIEVEKFSNLKEYYLEKFKLMSKFLSEKELNQFLTKMNEDMNIISNNSQLQNPKIQEDPENLEILKFLEKEEEKSETRIKKIIKINAEIQTKLLQEDHLLKLQQLQELRLQQNRQLFKLIDELPSKFSNSSDPFLFIHKRPETTDEGLRKKNFLRMKPPKTQQSNTRPLRLENFGGYNPNIDPKNLFFDNLFIKSNGFNNTNPNINNIQKSYIDVEKDISKNIIRACTSDSHYRNLKAEDCKNCFVSNINFLKRELGEGNVFFKNTNKPNYENEVKGEALKEKKNDENKDQIIKPSQKKEENQEESSKFAMGKLSALPESLRNILLQKDEKLHLNIEAEKPKYLTKFNQTKYHLKTQKNNKREKNQKKNENFEEKYLDDQNNEIGLYGVGLENENYRRNYAIYQDDGINNITDNNEKPNLFHYIDSREWNNNF